MFFDDKLFKGIGDGEKQQVSGIGGQAGETTLAYGGKRHVAAGATAGG
jgi:hypothetical protein